jgi:hypothetical protein
MYSVASCESKEWGLVVEHYRQRGSYLVLHVSRSHNSSLSAEYVRCTSSSWSNSRIDLEYAPKVITTKDI